MPLKKFPSIQSVSIVYLLISIGRGYFDAAMNKDILSYGWNETRDDENEKKRANDSMISIFK